MTQEDIMWIYEYKDDETPLGATLFEGSLKEWYDRPDGKLPHLQEPWHWRIDIIQREEEE